MNASPGKGGAKRLLTPGILMGRPWSGPSIPNLIFRQHLRVLARMYLHENEITRELREPCLRLIPTVESRTSLLHSIKRNRLNSIPVLVRMAYHHRSWIREPDSWCPDGGNAPHEMMRSLIRHLFNRYQVPSYAYGAWFSDGVLNQVEREWYCHLATGGDIRRFQGWVPTMTRKASHWFRMAPDNLSMKEAIRWGQVMAIQPDEAMANLVISSRAATDFRNDEIWLRLFEMWVSSAMDRSSLGKVIDYVWIKLNEGGANSIRLRGRDCRSLIASADACFSRIIQLSCPWVSDGIDDPEVRTRLIHYHRACWSPCDWIRPFERVIEGWRWRIRELTSQAELEEEALDMEHCVDAYGGDCLGGRSAILSLQSCRVGEENLERDVTIELDPLERRLVQVKAWRNRRPHPLTRRVVVEWCRENQIEAGAWSKW